jgi:flagellar hook assembly protein FlgD
VAHDETHVRIVMYNLQGQQIVILSEQKYSSGFYEVSWNGYDQNGNRLPAGAYVCQLQTSAGNQAKSQSKRVVVE